MPKFNWKVKSVAITLLVMLMVVGNPELRAFLLLLDFLGADLVLLLFGAYAYQYGALLLLHLRLGLAWLAPLVGGFLKITRWVAYGLHPRDGQWAQIDHIGIAGGVATRAAWGRLAA